MILGTPVGPPWLQRSPFPFSPLTGGHIPSLISKTAIDFANGYGGQDGHQLLTIHLDAEDRGRIDEADLAHLERKAMKYAGALGEIDALHIEWGATDRDDFDQLVMWERLGRILRKAGV